MTGIRGTYGYLIGDCGLPSGRGLVEGCEACVVVPEEDDRYKGGTVVSPLDLRLSGELGDCGLPSGRGLVEGCEACVVVPEEDDRYKGELTVIW